MLFSRCGANTYKLNFASKNLENNKLKASTPTFLVKNYKLKAILCINYAFQKIARSTFPIVMLFETNFFTVHLMKLRCINCVNLLLFECQSTCYEKL